MTTKQLCIDYLKALNEGNLADVRALFSDNAKVVSPLYGVLDAFDFYADLFKDTNRSETSLLNVFDTSEMSKSVALHFRYEWTLADGKLVSFECVDVFELNDARDRFEKLTIIYDTAPLRQDFDNLRRTYTSWTWGLCRLCPRAAPRKTLRSACGRLRKWRHTWTRPLSHSPSSL